MKKDIQSKNWIVDAVLFTGLCIASIIDLTGLALHQLLGLAVGALAGYHFLAHWTWVRAVTKRLVGRTSGQARRFYLIDTGLLISFSLILVSGVVISTWLSLSLSNYNAWHNLHILATAGTIFLVVVKIGFHWRWVVKIRQRLMRSSMRISDRKTALQPVTVPAKQTNMGRRDFLKLMSIVSAAAVVASYSALDTSTLKQSTNTNQSNPGQGASLVEEEQNNFGNSTSSSTCSVGCPRGCSYPGHCRRYVDANQNNRCDFGECA